jgi:hypothetical protein
MSILDDAIREHLELKRQHGADEAEVKRLEDEAFGLPGRPEEPDPLAEAPTEFLTTPEAEGAGAPETEGGRRINIADLQEPPAPAAPAEDAAQAAPPAEEPVPEAVEEPAMEHEVVEIADAGHSTEERHAIAEQPTEMFDVEAEMGTEDAPATEAPSPSDEELVEAETEEPRLAPVEPATEIYAARTEPPAEELADEEEEDEEFWSEQRLSDELDQALEAPFSDELEDEEPEEPEAQQQPQLVEEPPAEEPRGEQPVEETESQVDYDPDTGHEDVLEDTPEFLEDAPEDDDLWFEQRPPKDFDFDD